MKDFLIESTIALAVFIGLYHLLFERESMHRFKRLYLLSAPLFALALPFITFVIVKPVEAVAMAETPVIETFPLQVASSSATPEAFDGTLIFVGIYLAVTIVLLARLAITLFRFRKIAMSNTRVYDGNTTLVLLNDTILPHTFLNYIFLNKKDYLSNTIEPELVLHEQTHANQWHTLDVLFIELLKAVYWFNPLLYLYSRAIRLNHEFLADESVITKRDVKSYQNLLLEKASHNSGFAMASHLNYSLTKKRLLMMTKKSSAVVTAVKKLAVLPVIAALLSLLCIDVQAQVTEAPQVPATAAKTPVSQGEVTIDEYFAGVQFIAYERGKKDNKAQNGMRTTGKKLIDKKFEDLTPEERDVFKVFLHVPKRIVKKSPNAKEFTDFKNQKKYAIWIDGKNVSNSKLNNYKPGDIAYFSGSSVFKNARTKQHPQPFQFWLFTHKHFDENDMGKAPKKYGGDNVEIWKYINENKADNKPLQTEETAPENQIVPEDDLVHFSQLDVKPEYPGGLVKLNETIVGNYKSMNDINARENVYIEFTIEKDGSTTGFTILRASSKQIGESAIKAFPADVKWSPGMKDGKAAKTRMKLPIQLQ